MRIVAHTPYGVFESIEEGYDKDKFKSIAGKLEKELLETQLLETPIFVFNYAHGKIYFTPEMIKQSLFVLEK